VAPSTDSGAFTANGSAALGSALSETRTSALALRARLGERVTQQLADVVVTGNEEAMGPIVDSFAVVDAPAERDDAVRGRVMALLDRASDAITSARIAVRRDDRESMGSAATELEQVAEALESAEEALS
jgi:hypothetical protein